MKCFFQFLTILGSFLAVLKTAYSVYVFKREAEVVQPEEEENKKPNLFQKLKTLPGRFNQAVKGYSQSMKDFLPFFPILFFSMCSNLCTISLVVAFYWTSIWKALIVFTFLYLSCLGTFFIQFHAIEKLFSNTVIIEDHLERQSQLL